MSGFDYRDRGEVELPEDDETALLRCRLNHPSKGGAEPSVAGDASAPRT